MSEMMQGRIETTCKGASAQSREKYEEVTLRLHREKGRAVGSLLQV